MKRMILSLLAGLALHAAANTEAASSGNDASGLQRIKTVFVILMENHNWADIKHSPKAPYINSLLDQGASADRYYNPPALHPSEPNYVWLVAGDNHGIHNDADPTRNGLHGVENLASQLNARGVSWTSYQEDINGKSCPVKSDTPYAAKHNPFVFFDDLTDNFRSDSASCIAHNRPFEEFKADLAANHVSRYVFITPNLCNDMHGDLHCLRTIKHYDEIRQGDAWLKQVVPMIQQSAAYQDNGALFITWDESEGSTDQPIGLIALSPVAKAGYVNTQTRFTHSALLRTVEEIFSLPPLGDAAKSDDLRDLFN